jgi:hypothetical protein
VSWLSRQLEAKLALGDLGFLSEADEEPTFAIYAEKWLKTEALLASRRP